MKKLKTMLTIAVIAIAVICVVFSCAKDETKSSKSSNHKSIQTEKKDMNLIAEITTDSTYKRVELLDLGNIYESQWDKRYFENGEFLYDVKYVTNVLNTSFAIISCNNDRIIIETDDGDTVSFFNIVSLGNKVTFDMLRDDNKLIHFKFITDSNINFVKDLQSAMNVNNTKFAFLPVVTIIGAAAAVAGTAVAIVALARAERNRNCDIIKRNGEKDCNDNGCGIREGDCCVWCVGGSAHPNCKKDGAVRGNGSDCNNH